MDVMFTLPAVVPAGSHPLALPRNQTAAMRLLLEAVQSGYVGWTGGSVPYQKALRFADKMGAAYEVFANANRRAYRKRTGHTNARLLMYPDTIQPDHIRFWLLVTEARQYGSHRQPCKVQQQERLLDARQRAGRLRWGEQYELVRVSKPKKLGGQAAWTWRVSQRHYAEWEAAVRETFALTGASQPHFRAMAALVDAIRAMPGFHGIRQQQYELLRLAALLWRKLSTAPFPRQDEVLPYLDKGFLCYHRPEPLRLDVLVRVMEQRLGSKTVSSG